MQLVDTHVHLNFPVFKDEIDAIAQAWRKAGVARLVHSCVEPGEFNDIRALADCFPEISFAVGLHPLDVADRWSPHTMQEILELAQSDTRVVAIGETGLDFFKADNVSNQIESFVQHLDVARQLGLPVIIHCRDAASKMVEVLREVWRTDGSVRGVMHCWSGTPEETQWFLDLGFYISFSGIVTFKKASQVHESAMIVPDDRLLIETDCPFLTPVPYRGKRHNQPAYVQYVAEKVAQIRQIPINELARITSSNACNLFKISLND